VPIFFDYGQHCAEKEWHTLQIVLPPDGVAAPERIDISGIFRGSRSKLMTEVRASLIGGVRGGTLVGTQGDSRALHRGPNNFLRR